MQITSNKVVSLKYKLSNHHSGEKIEETNEENPLVFLYGVGGLIPEFEENLADKKIATNYKEYQITFINRSGVLNLASFEEVTEIKKEKETKKEIEEIEETHNNQEATRLED